MSNEPKINKLNQQKYTNIKAYFLGLSTEIAEYMSFAEHCPCHLRLGKYQQVKTDLSVS